MDGGGRIVTFYSYKGGVGRTMALANVAWILACNGKRVLAVDWDLETPGLAHYFHPFMEDKGLKHTTGVIDLIRDYATAALDPPDPRDPHWYAVYARPTRHAFSLRWPFQEQGQLDFLAAGQQTVAYAAAVGTFDWANFFARLGGSAFLKAMRAEMRERYDYVLIDSRNGLSETAGLCTVALADIVVNCFALNTQSIEAAAGIAHSIAAQRPAGSPVRILPVPMRVEAEAEQVKLDAAREAAQTRFEPFLDRLSAAAVSRHWAEVAIPNRPFYSFEEVLAAFGDRRAAEGSLLRAYERLTAAITDEAVSAFPPIEDHLRRKWLTRFGQPRQDSPSHVVIVFVSGDRVWADWIASMITEPHTFTFAEVERIGRDDFGHEIGSARHVLFLLSQESTRSEAARALWAVAARRQTDTGPLVMGVQVESVLTNPFDHESTVDLSEVNERRARSLMLRALHLSGQAAGGGAAVGAPRYPRTPAPVTNLPQRNAFFTGRAAVLDRLRNNLSRVTMAPPQVLHGMGGVGKTQVVLEYAHRYAAYYDVIWWIAAEQPGLVRSGLVSLAENLSMPGGENVEDNVLAVLEALRRGDPYSRWLLIFDNVGDPEELQGYLPAGTGHVLLTSRGDPWWDQGGVDALELEVFVRAESVALLRKRLPNLAEGDLHEVAEKLGDLPLAIEQAGAWLAATGMPVAQYVELLDTHILRLLEEVPTPGYLRPVATTWLVSLERMRAENPAAAKLLEICAFFSTEPIPLSMITGSKSQRIIDALLRFDPMLRDPIIRARMIREIGRFALARIDSSGPSIQLHRLVRAVIRAVLTPDAIAENRSIAQEALAAANPRDPDDSANWPAYREIRAHLIQPDALDSQNRDVRQLILDLVRFLYRVSDYTGSLELAEAALSRWQSLPDGVDDAQTLLLRCYIATAMRATSRFAEALAVGQDVHQRMLATLGADHIYTITALSGIAADQRAMGNYTEALRLQRQTYDWHVSELGDEADRTLMAANNLAVSLRLVGDFREARSLDEATLAKRRILLPPGSWYTLASANNLARDLRELGDYESAFKLLDATLAEFRRVFGEKFTETQRTARNFAIILRKLGRIREAFDLSRDTLRALNEIHGPRHPETLACAGNLAANHSALGHDVTAYEQASEVYERHRAALGDRHPFTLGAANNLAIFAHNLQRIEEAEHYSQLAVASLRDLLGAEHPYTLIASANLANGVFAAGRVDLAYRLDQETYRLMAMVLGPDHPDCIVVQSNLAISALANQDGQAAAQIRAEALARARSVFGADHPNTTAVETGLRLSCDFDPPTP